MMHRWNQHCAQAKSSKGDRWHFTNAIKKYGKDAFSHEVLAMSWDLEGANETEETMIEQEGTRNLEKGFNISKGGGTNVPNNTTESRDRRSMATKLKWTNPEFRSKVIASLTGRKFCSNHLKKMNDVLRKNAINGIFSGTGKIWSQEEKLKSSIREKEICWKHSIEAKKKISIAVKSRSRKENCKYGHSLNDAIIRRKRRECRTCKKLSDQRYRHRVSRISID